MLMVHSGTLLKLGVKQWVWLHMNNDVSSVWQVVESSKRWWKCRNRFNQIGFVPFNILEPMAHIDSPVSTKPPSVRHKKTHTHHMYTSEQADTSALTCTYLRVNSTVIFSLQAPAPPPLAKTFSVVPPSPPAPPQAPSHLQRPLTLPAYSQHIPAAEDTDNKGTKPCVLV